MAAPRALHVKSVHVVARRMMLGDVERLEIVVRRFALGPFHHAEADREENALQLFVRLANDVARADGPLDAWERKIDLVARLCRALSRRFDFLAFFLKRGFDVRLQLVEFLPDRALQLRRSRL